MLVVSKDVCIAYANFLLKQGAQKNVVYAYQKWLRFYLDFCSKYHHDSMAKQSIDAFLTKLTEKKQPDQSKKEAKRAVQYYMKSLMAVPGSSQNVRNREQPLTLYKPDITYQAKRERTINPVVI